MAGEYHSTDFEWDELRGEIEKDSAFLHHVIPFDPSSSSSPSFTDSEAWRSFHKRHSTGRFFKERRYLLKEFPELVDSDGGSESLKLLEVGCGNGSTVLPILRAKEDIIVYACDCSTDALDATRQMIDAAVGSSVGNRLQTFLLDFTANEFPKWLCCSSCRTSSSSQISHSVSDIREANVGPNSCSVSEGSECCTGGVNFVSMVKWDWLCHFGNGNQSARNMPDSHSSEIPSLLVVLRDRTFMNLVTRMIFTLSAVPFQKMPFVIRECFSVLKPGGLLLFRDYGLYDMTMLRFPPNQRAGFREYMRYDGTLSCFFSLDVTRDLFLNAGFLELELEYCCVRSLNRNNGKNMRRVWVHGKFQKPI